MDNPFTLTLFSKAFEKQGVVAAPVRCEFDLEWNDLGVATIEVNPDDPMREYLELDGARIRADYRGEHLFSGKTPKAGGDVTRRGTILYEFADEWRLMRNTLAWVVPSPLVRSDGLLAAQDLSDSAQSYQVDLVDPGTAGNGSPFMPWPDGSANFPTEIIESAESAIKYVIRVNMVSRLGLAVSIEPNLDRGGDALAAGELPDAIRFDRISDALAPLIDWCGLTVKLWHDGTTAAVKVDVAEPVNWPAELTVESGIIASGRWERNSPTATRIVLGGPGKDISRVFTGVNDSNGYEAQYGEVIEVYRDATGFNIVWPDALADELRVEKYFLLEPTVDAGDKARFNAYMLAAGKRALREGLPTVGLSLELSETDGFHFHGSDGIHLGDLVKVRIEGVPLSDRLRGANLVFDIDGGLTVRPRVGGRVDTPSMSSVRAIAKIAAAQRRTATSR